jgi:hypothetical protein
VTALGEDGPSSASQRDNGELYTSTNESDIRASKYGRGKPPRDPTTHQQCPPRPCARQQTVCPQEARRSTECRRNGRYQEKLNPKRVERTCRTTEKGRRTVWESAHDIVRSPIRYEGPCRHGEKPYGKNYITAPKTVMPIRRAT